MPEPTKPPKPHKARRLHNAAEVIKFYKGDIPDWGSKKQRVSFFLHEIIVSQALYLKSLELMENAKHVY